MGRKRFLLKHIKQLRLLYKGSIKFYGPYKGKDNRFRVQIRYTDGSQKVRQFAKLKMEVKLSRLLNKDETVDHIDEDVTNDKYSNLQVLSHAHNARKSYHIKGKDNFSKYRNSELAKERSSKRILGEKNPNSSFKDKDVIKLRKLFEQGKISKKEIEENYKVSGRAVSNMLNRTSYKHL